MQFVEEGDNSETWGDALHRQLSGFGHMFRNLDIDGICKFVNGELLAFTLGCNLDQWCADALPMATTEQHIEFIDECMLKIVLPSISDVKLKEAIKQKYFKSAMEYIDKIWSKDEAPEVIVLVDDEADRSIVAEVTSFALCLWFAC